jgi:hypothetical protein
MLTYRFHIATLTLACAFAACDAPTTETDLARHHKLTVDAAPVVVDASATTGDITCYTEGDPTATCTLPVHCCFSNYSSEHDGSCTTDACAFGTITCDGPEDCAGGVCCAHAITDPYDGAIGYTVACQTSCGSGDREICHPASGCSTGTSCVTAYGNDNALPRTLFVCQ